MDVAEKMGQSVSLLRMPRVIERTGKSRGAIYADIAEGTFPAPVKIGVRAVAWPSNAIDSWIEGVIQGAPHDAADRLLTDLPGVSGLLTVQA